METKQKMMIITFIKLNQNKRLTENQKENQNVDGNELQIITLRRGPTEKPSNYSHLLQNGISHPPLKKVKKMIYREQETRANRAEICREYSPPP